MYIGYRVSGIMYVSTVWECYERWGLYGGKVLVYGNLAVVAEMNERLW